MNPTKHQIWLAALCLATVSSLLLAQAAEPNTNTSSSKQQVTKDEVTDEMQLINKSLEGLLSELALIKREATGRLSQVRNRLVQQPSSSAAAAQQVNGEQIRQTKVSKFVLKRVAELELESLGMRDEVARLFELQKRRQAQESAASRLAPKSSSLTRQEDHDFEDLAPSTTAAAAAATTTAHNNQLGTPTSTLKPEQAEQAEAQQIGFDLEALKKLGTQLESEIEARQAQNPNSLRGVHEQVIRLVDNMVQSYLGNMRRTIQRFNSFVDGRRSALGFGPAARPQAGGQPRESPAAAGDINQQINSQSVVDELRQLSRRFDEFSSRWQQVVAASATTGASSAVEARQQSPLIDRIPPRGVELWRDFWDTVRRQVRRINQEFVQISRDMTRMITGRLPSGGFGSNGRPRDDQPTLLYSAASEQLAREQQVLAQKFQEFYDKLSVTLGEEQAKMEGAMTRLQGQTMATDAVQTVEKAGQSANDLMINQLIDEQDDEATKAELIRNVALRQQIQQEINVFGSIFDIMRAFIQRLRESTSTIRDVLTPGAMNSNDAVTPGPAIKPTVDQLLEDTINSQRNINGQAKPVLVPNQRIPRQ